MRKHNSNLLSYITVLCIENIRKYLLSYAIVLGIAVGLYRLLLPYNTLQFTLVNTPHNVFQFVFSLLRFFLMFVFVWNVSSVFHAMHDQRRATMFYTLPVSSASKFWGIFLFSFVGGVALFFCAIILFMLLASFISGISRTLLGDLLERIELFTVLKWIYSLMFAHSLFFLGAVFFKRRHFLYTIGVLTIFFVLFIRSVLSLRRISWFNDLWYSVPSSFWYCIGAVACWAFAYVCYKRSSIR